jgi:hypothetical protein
MLNKTCLCEQQRDSCYQGSCTLAWEREDYLTWLNGTCSNISTWHGLQSDWTQRLDVLRSEIMPWAVNVTALDSEPYLLPANCPSLGAKLGAFAGVNLGMALLIPILGRRDVIHWLSRGYLGKQDSVLWAATALFAVALHIGSNVISAYLVNKTPGFEETKIWDLALLWCTRPRMAWIITALIPFRAEDSLYFSVAASTLCSELVLQLVGAKVMGSATNYARIQNFYTRHQIDTSPYGPAAKLMYVGSLMWLVLVIGALIAGVLTLVGITTICLVRKAAVKRFQRKIDKKYSDCSWKAGRWNYEKNEKRGGLRQIYLPEEVFKQECENLQSAWMEVANRWSSLRNVDQTTGFPHGQAPRPTLSITDRGRVDAILRLLEHYHKPRINKYDYVSPFRPPPRASLKWERKRYSSEISFVESRLLSADPKEQVEYQQILSRLQEHECLELQLRAQLLPSPEDGEKTHYHCLGHCLGFDHGWREIALDCIELDGIEGQSDEFKRAQSSSMGDLIAAKGKSYFTQLALIPLIGMLGCWVAQWLWWIGYVQAAGDW